MIEAKEKGRRLHVTIGDEDDNELFIIEPVNVEQGALLLAHFLSIYAGVVADALEAGTDLAMVALGEDNYERAQQLRSEEFKGLVHAAFFWNVQGGGSDAMNTYLQDGLPKAVEAVFAAAGVQLKQP